MAIVRTIVHKHPAIDCEIFRSLVGERFAWMLNDENRATAMTETDDSDEMISLSLSLSLRIESIIGLSACIRLMHAQLWIGKWRGGCDGRLVGTRRQSATAWSNINIRITSVISWHVPKSVVSLIHRSYRCLLAVAGRTPRGGRERADGRHIFPSNCFLFALASSF